MSFVLLGKGSVKLNQSGGMNSLHKPVVHVSLSLREDVKLNESESAWKPTRFRKLSLSEEDQKDQVITIIIYHRILCEIIFYGCVYLQLCCSCVLTTAASSSKVPSLT